jgi:D-alanine-D-alanine ligase
MMLRKAPLERPYIIKSITEHASFGIFADSIVADTATLQTRAAEKKRKHGSEWFAEEYIDGREFNLSLLATDDGVSAQVLPPAEILFTSDFPAGQPRIVDYAAKWHTESAECIGTVRSFAFADADAALLEQLKQTAIACWHAFSLNGYARVDYRIANDGTPYVLEVNCNPFLSAVEGFGAAAAQAGIPFPLVIRSIVSDAYRRSSQPLPAVLAA